jgi:hypothetical protein
MSRRTLIALLLTTAARVAADEGTPPSGYSLNGSVSAGYRMVDIDGAKDRYKEDLNLRSGGRFFGFELSGTARNPAATRLDRFHLLVDGPHDEPTSHYLLTAGDRSLWDLRANFTRSKYFYAVPQLWEQPVAGNRRLDDLHDFDLDRTNGQVDLTLRPTGLPQLRLGYRLSERHGRGISTVLLPGGDTFLANAPVDAVAHVGLLGTDFTVVGTDVSVTQEYRQVDRRFDRTAPVSPAGTPGVDPADASTLGRWDTRHDERIEAPTTRVRLRRSVGQTLDLTGAYVYTHAELDSDRTRLASGTTSGTGAPTRAIAADRSAATLDAHVLDLAATWRLHEHVRLHASYRMDDRSQNGQLDSQGSSGTFVADGGYHLRLHRTTADVEAEPRSDLSLRVGSVWTRRDARFTVLDTQTTTDSVGAIGDLRWQPLAWWDGWLRYENAQVDDPLVLEGSGAIPAREIQLTVRNRGAVGFRLRPRPWFTVRYELVADSRENGTFDARSEAFGNTVSLVATPKDGLTVSTSYARRDIDSRADIYFAPTSIRRTSVQQGTEDVLTAEGDWDFDLFGQRWSARAFVTWVDAATVLGPRLEPNQLARSFFDLSRIDGGATLTWRHRLFEPSLEFRMIEYDERVLPANDYRATIVAIRVTKRFGTE